MDNLSFCEVCGKWLRPDEGNLKIENGEPILICDDCGDMTGTVKNQVTEKARLSTILSR